MKKTTNDLDDLSKFNIEEIAEHYARETADRWAEMSKEFDHHYEEDPAFLEKLKQNFIKFLRKKENDNSPQ